MTRIYVGMDTRSASLETGTNVDLVRCPIRCYTSKRTHEDLLSNDVKTRSHSFPSTSSANSQSRFHEKCKSIREKVFDHENEEISWISYWHFLEFLIQIVTKYLNTYKMVTWANPAKCHFVYTKKTYKEKEKGKEFGNSFPFSV